MLAALAAIDTLCTKEMGKHYQNMGLLCRDQGGFAHDCGDHPGDLKRARPCFSAGAMISPFRGQVSNVKLRMTEEDVIY